MHWPDFPALTILGICGEAKCTLQQKLLAKPRKISCGPEGTCLVYSSSLNHVLVCRKQRVVEKKKYWREARPRLSHVFCCCEKDAPTLFLACSNNIIKAHWRLISTSYDMLSKHKRCD